MTPNDIDVLLHYHCTPANHERIGAPAVTESIQMWQDCGVLDSEMRTTERGKCLVEMLCATPLPEWRDPRTTP